MVLLPGWSQSGRIFDHQLAGLSGGWRIVSIDHRGHGESSTPPTGYHIHRLAADLRDVIAANEFDSVHLLGHSMGCAVIWSYLELFGSDGLASLTLVDQMSCALRNPAWSDQQALDAGATMDAAGLFAFTDALRDTAEVDPRAAFLADVTSPALPPEQLAWLVGQGSTFDRQHAAELIFDVATHDWRPFVRHIRLPTLVVAGDSVNVPLPSQQWICSEIPGARFACVRARGGGTHFPFLESPDLFNAVVSEFLDEVTTSGTG